MARKHFGLAMNTLKELELWVKAVLRLKPVQKKSRTQNFIPIGQGVAELSANSLEHPPALRQSDVKSRASHD